MISPEIALHHKYHNKQKDAQTNGNHISIFVEDPKTNTCVLVSMYYLFNITEGKNILVTTKNHAGTIVYNILFYIIL